MRPRERSRAGDKPRQTQSQDMEKKMEKWKRNDKRLGAIVDMEGYSYASIGATGYFVEVEAPTSTEEVLNRPPEEETL